jgi:CRISPR-associated protein Csb1
MPIASANRLLLDVDLAPVAGSRFQPTGFPDIGAAQFLRPEATDGRVDWQEALLVESAQSMANRLEGTAWDDAANQPVATFSGLPYIRVVHADDGGYLTSSRTEAHRLASAFVKDAALDGVGMRQVIRDRLGLRDDRPLAPVEIARAVFGLDPFCLVHGVFFAEPASIWPGQPRIARALTAEIEAREVHRADSGGVKRDHVRHAHGEAGGSAEGYGSIPFHRTEWTAARIVASFCLDRAQIRSYGLGEAATALLEAVARWEIRSLLDGVLRLRTACDLMPVADELVDRSGQALPALDAIDAEVRDLIPECADLTGGGEPIVVRWPGGAKEKRSKGAKP